MASSSSSSFFFCLIVCLLMAFCAAEESAPLNITQLLEPYPNYSSFNSLLSKYGVVSDIYNNRRKTLTILCPPNAVIDTAFNSQQLSSASFSTFKNILSYHVLLDYYDATKLQAIPQGSTLVTTLFQSSGLAALNHGFLNITLVDGTPKCGLPSPGSPLTATIGSSFFSHAYDIIFLSIDSLLIPLDATASPPPYFPSPSIPAAPPSAPAPPPAPAPAPVPAPAPAPIYGF